MTRWIASFGSAVDKAAFVAGVDRQLVAGEDGTLNPAVRIVHDSTVTPIAIIDAVIDEAAVRALVNEACEVGGKQGQVRVERDVLFVLCTTQTRSMLSVDIVDLSIHGPFDGEGIIIAVIDGGIDDTHPDLAGKVVARWRGTRVEDPVDPGHGTMIAGLTCGSGTSSDEKHAGIAPGAKLLDCIVFDSKGMGWLSDIILALEFAVLHGARIACMPFTIVPDQGEAIVLREVMGSLSTGNQVHFCCGVGNWGTAGSIGMPGASEHAITTASISRDRRMAPFSTRGTRSGRSPDVALPGQRIISANVFSSPWKDEPLDENEHYAIFSGNSVSVAMLAGIVAKVLSYRDMDPAVLKSVLVDACTPVRGTTRERTGAGIPNIERLFARLGGFFPVRGTPRGIARRGGMLAVVLTFTILAFAMMLASFM